MTDVKVFLTMRGRISKLPIKLLIRSTLFFFLVLRFQEKEQYFITTLLLKQRDETKRALIGDIHVMHVTESFFAVQAMLKC